MYDESELLALKKVLTVFEDYIQESEYFDILSSRKFGYLIMVFGTGLDEVESIVVDSAEALCELLFSELADDVIDAMKVNPPSNITPEVRSAILARLQPYLDQLPEYAHLANRVLPL